MGPTYVGQASCWYIWRGATWKRKLNDRMMTGEGEKGWGVRMWWGRTWKPGRSPSSDIDGTDHKAQPRCYLCPILISIGSLIQFRRTVPVQRPLCTQTRDDSMFGSFSPFYSKKLHEKRSGNEELSTVQSGIHALASCLVLSLALALVRIKLRTYTYVHRCVPSHLRAPPSTGNLSPRGWL